MKKTVEEFFYFILIQASNYILPLLTFPYLIRVFGMGTFGEYVLIQTVLSYFMLLVDFGFNVTGVKKISQARSDNERSEIFNTIMASKIALIVVSVMILLISSIFFKHLQHYYKSYIFAFPLIIGQAIFPIWYYQAIQKMRTATIINVGIKIFFTACIFIFIKNASDFNYALLINSIGFVFGGLVSLIPIYYGKITSIKIPKFYEIKHELIDSWRVFASRVFTSMYSSTNILVLAYFNSPFLVGQYSAADKVFRALYNVTVPFIQVFFPKQAKLFKLSKEAYTKLSRQIFFLLLVLGILIGLGIYFTAPYIVKIVVGSTDVRVVKVLRIFSLSVVLYPFGGLFTNMLAIQDMNKVLLRAVSLSALINFILVIPVIYFYSIEGLAYLSFITQLFIFTYKGICIIKNLNQQKCVEFVA